MKPTQEAGRIDWPAVHRHLATVSRQLEGQMTIPPERFRAILQARARTLAAEPPPAAGRRLQVLEFFLAGEHYAIESKWVRAVLPLSELTPLPGTPGFVLGIIHVRGQVVSVLDIKKFFDLPEQGLSDLNRVILLADGTMQFGILADRIVGATPLLLDDLQSPLPTLTGVRAEYLLGITRRHEVVLDGRKLLSDPAVVVDQEVTR